MGKAERIRRMNARERIAAQQAAARRAEARRRMFLASGSVLGVLVIVIVLIVVKAAAATRQPAASTGPAPAPPTVTPVSSRSRRSRPATLNTVGKGSGVSPLIATSGQPALTSGGKPEILYMGAEYCPYCAAERWAMVVALSRFGTFSNLHLIHSSSADVYPTPRRCPSTNRATPASTWSSARSRWYGEKATHGGYTRCRSRPRPRPR